MKNNYDYFRERFDEENKIDLYPEVKDSFEDYFTESDKYETKIFREKQRQKNILEFCDNIHAHLLSTALNEAIVIPVLEADYSNSKQFILSDKLMTSYVLEQNSFKLINKMYNQNIYLNDIASVVDEAYSSIIEQIKDDINSGMTQEDAFNIEFNSIKDNFITKSKAAIPNNITKIICDKVQDSVQDFIDYNKDNKFRIQKIYDDTKSKIQEISKMKLSNESKEIMKKDYLNEAKYKESKILEEEKNLFGSITSILLESIYSISSLRESYTKKIGINNKIDLHEVVNTSKVIYAFLESLNTLNLETINKDYIKNVLIEMKQSINEVVDPNNDGNSEKPSGNVSYNRFISTPTKLTVEIDDEEKKELNKEKITNL